MDGCKGVRNGVGGHPEILQDMWAAVKSENPHLIGRPGQYGIQESVEMLHFAQLRRGVTTGLYDKKKRARLRIGVAQLYLLLDSFVLDGEVTCRKVISNLS